MVQGVLGVIGFYVTEDMFMTFKDLKRERKIQFAQHKVVFGTPKLQHTGRELDKYSLQVILHPTLNGGHSVDLTITAIRLMAALGQEVPLVLGLSILDFVVVESVSASHTIFHNGMTWHGVVDLSLLEYN